MANLTSKQSSMSGLTVSNYRLMIDADAADADADADEEEERFRDSNDEEEEGGVSTLHNDSVNSK